MNYWSRGASRGSSCREAMFLFCRWAKTGSVRLTVMEDSPNARPACGGWVRTRGCSTGSILQVADSPAFSRPRAHPGSPAPARLSGPANAPQSTTVSAFIPCPGGGLAHYRFLCGPFSPGSPRATAPGENIKHRRNNSILCQKYSIPIWRIDFPFFHQTLRSVAHSNRISVRSLTLCRYFSRVNFFADFLVENTKTVPKILNNCKPSIDNIKCDYQGYECKIIDNVNRSTGQNDKIWRVDEVCEKIFINKKYAFIHKINREITESKTSTYELVGVVSYLRTICYCHGSRVEMFSLIFGKIQKFPEILKNLIAIPRRNVKYNYHRYES